MWKQIFGNWFYDLVFPQFTEIRRHASSPSVFHEKICFCIPHSSIKNRAVTFLHATRFLTTRARHRFSTWWISLKKSIQSILSRRCWSSISSGGTALEVIECVPVEILIACLPVFQSEHKIMMDRIQLLGLFLHPGEVKRLTIERFGNITRDEVIVGKIQYHDFEETWRARKWTTRMTSAFRYSGLFSRRSPIWIHIGKSGLAPRVILPVVPVNKYQKARPYEPVRMTDTVNLVAAGSDPSDPLEKLRLVPYCKNFCENFKNVILESFPIVRRWCVHQNHKGQKQSAASFPTFPDRSVSSYRPGPEEETIYVKERSHTSVLVSLSEIHTPKSSNCPLLRDLRFFG